MYGVFHVLSKINCQKVFDYLKQLIATQQICESLFKSILAYCRLLLPINFSPRVQEINGFAIILVINNTV